MRFQLAPLLLLALAVAGCESGQVDPEVYSEAVAVAVAKVTLDSPDAPPDDPTPDATKTCPDCQGSGRVKTGDGISTTECDTCDGTGKVARLDIMGMPLGTSRRIYEVPIRPAVYSPIGLADLRGQAIAELPDRPVPLIEDSPDGGDCDSCAAGVCDIGGCAAGCAGSCSTSYGASYGNETVTTSRKAGPVRRLSERPRRLFRRALQWRPLKAIRGRGLFRGGRCQ